MSCSISFISRSRITVRVIFSLSAFFLAGILYSPQVFSAYSDITQQQIPMVCMMPSAKNLSREDKNAAEALERKYSTAEKRYVSIDRARYLLLASTQMSSTTLEQWQWYNLKGIIDDIQEGDITVQELMIDDNNGQLKQVSNSRSLYALDFSMDEKQRFHRDFFIHCMHMPYTIPGVSHTVDHQLYVFHMNTPLFNPKTGALRFLPFAIYRKISADNSYRWPACEFEFIHQQGSVR